MLFKVIPQRNSLHTTLQPPIKELIPWSIMI